MKNHFKLITFLFCIFISKSTYSQWTQIGPAGGIVACFAADANNIYAGTGGGGIYKSSNNGGSWSEINNGLFDNSITSLMIFNNKLFASGGDVVWMSSDTGQTWTYSSVDFGIGMVNDLIEFDNLIYAATEIGVYYSWDNGLHWLPDTINFSNMEVTCLVVVDTTIFAGTKYYGVYSRNIHSSWTNLNSLPNYTYTMCLSVNGNRIFLGTIGDGIYISDDLGNSWLQQSSGMPFNTTVNTIAFLNNNVYAGTRTGCYSTPASNMIWQSVNNGLSDTVVNSLFVNGNDLYAGTVGMGMFKSQNNGQSWIIANSDLNAMNITDIEKTGQNIIICGVGGIFSTSDSGLTWSSRNNGILSTSIHDLRVQCLYENAGILFAGSDHGYVSVDQGQSWALIDSGYPPYRNIIDIISQGTNLYSAADSIYISNNNGQLWNLLPNSFGGQQVLGVMGSRIFSSTYYNQYYSDDSGQTWNLLTNNPFTRVYRFVPDGLNLYVCTNVGLYVSSDSGLTWIDFLPSLHNTYVFDLVIEGNNMVVCSPAKVLHSADHGSSWNDITGVFSDELPNKAIISGRNAYIIAAGNSVYKYTNIISSVNEIPAIKSSFEIFPNPSNGDFYFHPKENLNNLKLSIINSLGEIVYSERFNSVANEYRKINPDLISGVYFVKSELDNHVSQSKLLIVK